MSLLSKGLLFSVRLVGFSDISAKIVIAALLLSLTAAAPALGGISPAWYDSVSTQTAASLRLTLGELLYSSHVRLGYNNTWEPIRTIDQTTTSPDHVQLIYGADTRLKSAGTASDGQPTSGGWNREHAFPQSFFNENEPMRSDIHALFPADTDINTHRSNRAYDYVTAPVPAYSDVLGNRAVPGVWEPADIDKGRVARAVLYMDVRYEGTGTEPDLTLTNAPPGGTGYGEMAYRDTLLAWHAQYPPTAFERARSAKAFVYQNNPNPFVDHPEWVSQIYGGPAWTPHNGDSIVPSPVAQPDATIAAGSPSVPVMTIPIITTGQEVHLAALTAQYAGTSPPEHLGSLRLWYDVDGDGAVSAPDSPLASAPVTATGAQFSLSHPFYFAPGTTQLLLTADVQYTATTGDTVAFQIMPGAFILSTTGGNDSVAPHMPLHSPTLTIHNPTDGLDGLLITEVLEGTQGNLKYVELYNPTTGTINLATADLALQRFTNGNSTTPTTILLNAGAIPPNQTFVIAHNEADFSATFGTAPDMISSQISHNGNDAYMLVHAPSSSLIDSFAMDRRYSADNFAVNIVAHRVPGALPNYGTWGEPLTGTPPDQSLSPSGHWKIRTLTSGNGNAALVGTPGSPGEPDTSGVADWAVYD